MRILHVFDHSLPLQSGYVSRSLGIIRAQRARGWETVHLTTPRYHPSDAGEEIVDGLGFHRSRGVFTGMPVLREMLEMRSTKAALCELIARTQPDLIHAHSPVLNVLPALAAGHKANLPVFYEVRALWEDAAVDLKTAAAGGLKYRTVRGLETRALRRADHVFALCDSLRDEILGRGLAPQCVSVAPNAIDASLLATAASNEAEDAALRERLGARDRFVAGFIGSFYGYEGLDLLLEAIPLLSQRVPALLVLLVGGGPDEARLRSRVEKMGLEAFVRFAGRVHHREVPRYYRLMDVMVFPRRKMRLTDLVTPLKPLEAMAQCKPVVASDVGGHLELIKDGETGFLFAADKVEALVARLETVVKNRALRADVAAAGRRFVERERLWNSVVDRYAPVYERFLKYRGAPRLAA